MSEPEDQKPISPFMAILGMVNGMIGGLILLLPVFSLNAGYLLTFVIILVTCVFSYYSCYLCLIHLGDQPDLDFAIFRHFNGNRIAKVFYDLCVWSNLILIDMLYFGLITIQWVGLIPPHHPSWINSAANAMVLFFLVFVLKYFEFGTSLMAYGIISIVSYVIFLVWAISTYNQGYHESQIKPIGTGAVTLAAAMGQAFSIQSFFIPVIKKAPNPQKYTHYTLIAYAAGCLAYYYIAYIGSTSIWRRHNFDAASTEQTIENYFDPGQWEVNVIEGIYLIHLYSVFPQFLLIGKKRMFGVIGLPESEAGKVTVPEIIYISLVIVACFFIGYFEVNIGSIIDINGSVIGFLFIYFIPAFLHIKCLYFSKGKRPLPQLELGESYEQVFSGRSDRSLSLGVEDHPPSIEVTAPPSSGGQNDAGRPLLGQERPNEERQVVLAGEEILYANFCCDVNLSTYSTPRLVLDWILIVTMVAMGVFIMINGLASVF